VSDKKQFAVIMLIASFFVVWILWANLSAIAINNKLKEDPEIRNYPYSFRVLRKKGTTAIMSTIRSKDVSATLALRTLFPKLKNKSDDSPAMKRALGKMAYIQVRAKNIVLSEPNCNVIVWELDKNWYRLNHIDITRKF